MSDPSTVESPARTAVTVDQATTGPDALGSAHVDHPELPPAVAAFDAVAEVFDSRYGGWLSVTAQRRAVRRVLAHAFPVGARVLEVGGGTGDDAHWLASQGRRVLMTDASPRMVEAASRKLTRVGAPTAIVAAEDLGRLAADRATAGLPRFDGAFSNFAALNCVSSLRPVAEGLAALLEPDAQLCIVLFGAFPPGEVIVQLAKRDPRAAFRRLRTGPVEARLGGHDFTVRYHRPGDVARAFRPWFRLVERVGIGVFVPPSAAEPWISRHPRLLSALEAMDRLVERPLALLGDHVLYRFSRTTAPATARRG